MKHSTAAVSLVVWSLALLASSASAVEVDLQWYDGANCYVGGPNVTISGACGGALTSPHNAFGPIALSNYSKTWYVTGDDVGSQKQLDIFAIVDNLGILFWAMSVRYDLTGTDVLDAIAARQYNMGPATYTDPARFGCQPYNSCARSVATGSVLFDYDIFEINDTGVGPSSVSKFAGDMSLFAPSLGTKSSSQTVVFRLGSIIFQLNAVGETEVVGELGLGEEFVLRDTNGTTGTIVNGQPDAWHDAAVAEAITETAPFSPAQNVSTSTTAPSSVTGADVDGDGDLDLLASTNSPGLGQVELFENTDGAGNFWSPRVLVSEPVGLNQVHAADLDGDGALDLLTASPLGDSIAWYENTDGAGTFGSQQLITTGAIGAAGVSSADIDNDGDVDVLSAAQGSGVVAWHENDGTPGGLGDWNEYLISNTSPSVISISAADFDRDGDADVLISTLVDTVTWFENDGTPGGLGDWTEHLITSTASLAWTSTAADLDMDGDLDVLSASYGDNDIVWFENTDGAGTFGIEQTITSTAGGAISVLALDVDGDADQDVLSAWADADTVAWHENIDGTGSFGPSRILSGLQQGPIALFAGDVDGDGDDDAVSASYTDQTIAWYRNGRPHSSVLYRPPTGIPATSGTQQSEVLAGDLDRDGHVDLQEGSASSDAAYWYESDGGTPPAFTERQITTGIGGVNKDLIALGDIDGDARDDLVVSQTGGNRLVWFHNNGGGPGFWTEIPIATGLTSPREVTVADLDDDGNLDVIATDLATDSVTWYDSAAAGALWTPHTITALHTDAWRGVAGDLNRDGHLDVLSCGDGITTPGGGAVAWHESDGTPADGGWVTHDGITSSYTNARTCEIADLNGDGWLDFVVPYLADDTIAWYENDGGSPPGFTEWVVRAGFPEAHGARPVDIDRDGDLDILGSTANQPDGVVIWFENDGSGSGWTEHVATDLADGSSASVPADLDNDGDLDLAFQSPLLGFYWLENRGGQFDLPTTDVSYLGMLDGQTHEVLQIDVEHQGLAGDASLELTSLELRFTDSVGTPLSSAQANALIAELYVYIDADSDGVHSPGDGLVGQISTFILASGAQTVTTSVGVGDPTVTPGTGGSQRYFVVVQLDAAASSATPSQFEIFHVTESSSTAEISDSDLAVTLAYSGDSGTGTVTTLDGTGDSDGDTLTDLAEGLIHGTDLLDADTDDDNVDDGVEVADTTDPTDPDSDDDGLDEGQEKALTSNPLNPDSDDDGYCDSTVDFGPICSANDNCPVVSNAGQADNDTATAGDLCQCGGVIGIDGINATDLQAIQEYVVGHSLHPGFILPRCDVTGDDICDIRDSAVVARIVGGATAPVVDACPYYFGL